MSILVEVKTVYGEERIYPICDKAKLLCALTNCKTFTRRTIALVKGLGYTVNVQQGVASL